MELERRTKRKALSGPRKPSPGRSTERGESLQENQTWFCVVAAVVDSRLRGHGLCVCREAVEKATAGQAVAR